MQIGSAYLAVQPSAVDEGQEELRAVGVRSCIRHAEHTFAFVLQAEILILKLVAIDALATSTVEILQKTDRTITKQMRHATAHREIASLAHEIWDHPVKNGPWGMWTRVQSKRPAVCRVEYL